MLFKIKEQKEQKIKGYLKPETKSEQVLLNIIQEEIKNIKFYNNKLELVENKIIFSDMTKAEINKILEILSNSLNFTYKVVE